jgi:hypothetical protein
MSEKLKLPKLKSHQPQPWVLVMIFLIGLVFSLIVLTYYSRLAALWPSGHLGRVIFWDLTLLGLAIGGLWWGDLVKGESATAGPLLALALVAGSLVFLLAPLLLPQCPIDRMVSHGWSGYFNGRIWLSLLLITPGFFLWGAAPPFLTALAFPNERGLGKGLFSICSLTFVALALGAVLLWHWPTEASPWLGRLIGLPSLPILIVGFWLWSKTPVDERQGLPFWPSSSLGLWTGDKVYGQEILVSPRRVKTLTPALFLGTMASSVAASVWAIPLLTESQAGWWPMAPLILVSLALGAMLLGPVLASLATPMTALGLDLLFLTLILAFGPRPPAEDLKTWLCLGIILTSLGALWPLAARLSQVRYGFIPSGLGHINFWFLGGLLIGLTITTAFLTHFPLLANFLYKGALISSILALVICWSWLWGLIALLTIGVWRWLL